MHPLLAPLLLILLNVHQPEGKKQIYLKESKKPLDEGVSNDLDDQGRKIKRGEQSGFYQIDNVKKSDVYESILKNIADVVTFKKNQLSGKAESFKNDANVYSSGDLRESYDKGADADPSLTKFYSFSKVSEEQKPFVWMDLLTAPIIQSLVKTKSQSYPRKNMLFPSYDRIHPEEAKRAENKKDDVDSASLNSILQFFSSFGNHHKKNQMRENDVGLSLHHPSSDILDDKLSCLVENKSNYFKADSCPYSKFMGNSAADILGLTVNGTNNVSDSYGRFYKGNYSVMDRYPIVLNDQIWAHSSGIPDNGQYGYMADKLKPLKWPNVNGYDDQNYTKYNSQLDSNLSVEKYYGKNKNSYDVLGDINLDPPNNGESDQNLKLSKYKNLGSNPNTKYYPPQKQSLEPNDIIHNSMHHYNLSDPNPNINLQRLMQSPDSFERLCMLNEFLKPSRVSDQGKSIFVSNNNDLSPLLKGNAESKYMENKCDIKTLANILNTKGNQIKFKSDTMQPDKSVDKANPVENEVRPEPIVNKMQASPIGEQAPSISLDHRVGNQKITLPEYEKMENVNLEPTSSPEASESTEVRYENRVSPTTPELHMELSSEVVPMNIVGENLNSLHRNMIPVIDFLGQMWNSSSRKHQGTEIASVGRSHTGDCGGYVIVPLPRSILQQGLRGLTGKAAAVTREAECPEPQVPARSPAVPSPSDGSLEKMVWKKVYDSLCGYLAPRRRSRRSKVPVVQDSHTQDSCTTPACPLNCTQLPPTDKWILNTS